MAREPKAAPHGFISVEEFIRTRDSVVTGLTSLTGGIHSLITAYINHSNQLLSGQGAEAESLDTAAINQFFVTGGIPPQVGLAGAALAPLKKEKKKRVKKERDPDAPKRPLTAFFLFSTNARDLVKRENPESTPVEVNNEILRRWNQMDEQEKQRWKDLYSKNNEQYKKDVEQYKAVKGEDAIIEPVADEEDMEEELVAPEEEEEWDEEEEVVPPAVAESTDSASDDSEAEPIKEATPPVVKKGKTAAKRKGAKENGQAALAALAANSPSPSTQLHKEVPIPLPEEAPTTSKRKKAVATKEDSPVEPKKKKTRKGAKQEETVEVAPPTVEKTKKKKRKSEGF